MRHDGDFRMLSIEVCDYPREERSDVVGIEIDEHKTLKLKLSRGLRKWEFLPVAKGFIFERTLHKGNECRG